MNNRYHSTLKGTSCLPKSYHKSRVQKAMLESKSLPMQHGLINRLRPTTGGSNLSPGQRALAGCIGAMFFLVGLAGCLELDDSDDEDHSKTSAHIWTENQVETYWGNTSTVKNGILHYKQNGDLVKGDEIVLHGFIPNEDHIDLIRLDTDGDGEADTNATLINFKLHQKESKLRIPIVKHGFVGYKLNPGQWYQVKFPIEHKSTPVNSNDSDIKEKVEEVAQFFGNPGEIENRISIWKEDNLTKPAVIV
jgi:hypothetical protein